MSQSTEEFMVALDEAFDRSEENGASFTDIRAGNLHKEVGGYDDSNHRMPACCGAMRNIMQNGDVILKQPEKGNGANLVIRYQVPRGKIR